MCVPFYASMKLLAWCFALTALNGCMGTTGSLSTVTGLQPVVSTTPTSASLIASLDGGLIGRTNTPSITARDKSIALQSEYRALEYTAPAQPVYWQSENGRLSGSVIPSQPYRVGSQDCRQYAHLITVNGTTLEQNGTACRNQDGSWSLLS